MLNLENGRKKKRKRKKFKSNTSFAKFSSRIHRPRLNWFRFLNETFNFHIHGIPHLSGFLIPFVSFERVGSVSPQPVANITRYTCRHTLERGVIGVQAKIVGDLIRNYKPLGTLCLMQRVLSAPLRKSSILSDEPIRNYPSWSETERNKQT